MYFLINQRNYRKWQRWRHTDWETDRHRYSGCVWCCPSSRTDLWSWPHAPVRTYVHYAIAFFLDFFHLFFYFHVINSTIHDISIFVKLFLFWFYHYFCLSVAECCRLCCYPLHNSHIIVNFSLNDTIHYISNWHKLQKKISAKIFIYPTTKYLRHIPYPTQYLHHSLPQRGFERSGDLGPT